MPRPSAPGSRFRFLVLLLPALLALAAHLGCPGKLAGTELYVFDGHSHTVLVWKNIEELYDAAEASKALPEPERKIESDEFNDLRLAWGGMALDSDTDTLYLVSVSGRVVAIYRASSQKGKLSAKADIYAFNVGKDSGRESNSDWTFGQASLDPSQDCLYLMEGTRNGNAHRIWQVRSPGNRGRFSLNARTLQTGKDTSFSGKSDRQVAGLAAGNGGRFYVLFGDGERMDDSDNHAVRGPRLRQGQNRGRGADLAVNADGDPIHTLIGAETKLSSPFRYGALAYDGRHQELYVYAGIKPTPESKAVPEILVFDEGQFTGRSNQPPRRTLPGAPADLRVLVHPPHADWLLGASFTAFQAEPKSKREEDMDHRPSVDSTLTSGTGDGKAQLTIWKSPHDSDEPITITLPEVQEIRGMAIGGH